MKKRNIIILLIQTSLAIVVAVLLIVMSGRDPVASVKQFLYGIAGSINGVTEILVEATPLIFLGLGISVAFTTGFFNIGAEGQFYLGALIATMVAVWFPLPRPFGLIVAMILSFIAGGVWAFIPAFLKSKFGISETVNTIMLNYIAIMIVGIMIRSSLQDPTEFLAQSSKIEKAMRIPRLFPPSRLHLGFLIAIIVAFLVYFITRHTTIGYEMKISGLNDRAAYCTGLNVMKSVLFSAFLSGGLAGLAGMNELLGVQYRLLEGLSGGKGYTAILIALLAKNHPLKVIVVSLLFATLQVGASTMQRQMAIPASIVSIITGFIVLMVLSKDLFRSCTENKRDLS